jgi:hypothetical protein
MGEKWGEEADSGFMRKNEGLRPGLRRPAQRRCYQKYEARVTYVAAERRAVPYFGAWLS